MDALGKLHFDVLIACRTSDAQCSAACRIEYSVGILLSRGGTGFQVRNTAHCRQLTRNGRSFVVTVLCYVAISIRTTAQSNSFSVINFESTVNYQLRDLLSYKLLRHVASISKSCDTFFVSLQTLVHIKVYP